ncbi:nucleoside monophosphate kinase [Candidatus Saccharibacteria bacterium]|nr:nucleoside monophosphate kinase [Candidatus Saccharibacteria bacterium]
MNNDISITEKLAKIDAWLGTGSINLFGLPMSGKDTQGVRLAEALDGKFLSSGLIIRAMEKETNQHLTDAGALIPTNIFYEWVLPYFERDDLRHFPLILSSIGRWSGEEDSVMSAARNAGHEIKAVILLNVSEADVEVRFSNSKMLNDRGDRADDKELSTFRTRINEFRVKTMPVLEHYRDLGLLITVKADDDRDTVFNNMVDALYKFAIS